MLLRVMACRKRMDLMARRRQERVGSATVGRGRATMMTTAAVAGVRPWWLARRGRRGVVGGRGTIGNNGMMRRWRITAAVVRRRVSRRIVVIGTAVIGVGMGRGSSGRRHLFSCTVPPPIGRQDHGTHRLCWCASSQRRIVGRPGVGRRLAHGRVGRRRQSLPADQKGRAPIAVAAIATAAVAILFPRRLLSPMSFCEVGHGRCCCCGGVASPPLVQC